MAAIHLHASATVFKRVDVEIKLQRVGLSSKVAALKYRVDETDYISPSIEARTSQELIAVETKHLQH